MYIFNNKGISKLLQNILGFVLLLILVLYLCLIDMNVLYMNEPVVPIPTNLEDSLEFQMRRYISSLPGNTNIVLPTEKNYVSCGEVDQYLHPSKRRRLF